MWLAINGKRTYGDMLTKNDSSDAKQEAGAMASGSAKKIKSEEKDDEDETQPAKKEGPTEMEKLLASLSRRSGTTGQINKRYQR